MAEFLYTRNNYVEAQARNDLVGRAQVSHQEADNAIEIIRGAMEPPGVYGDVGLIRGFRIITQQEPQAMTFLMSWDRKRNCIQNAVPPNELTAIPRDIAKKIARHILVVSIVSISIQMLNRRIAEREWVDIFP